MVRPTILLAFALGASGCSASRRAIDSAPPADLGDATRVQWWESVARPDLLRWVVAFATVPTTPRGSCPRVDRQVQGTRTITTVVGRCTDEEGGAWTGWVRVVSDDDAVEVRLHRYGNPKLRVSGRAALDQGPTPSFDADLELVATDRDALGPEGPAWLALRAHGQCAADGAWSGEGTLAAQGRGRLHMEATGLMFDDERCRHEPLAGRLRLTAGAHEVEITYDGATKCDEPGAAPWSLDGVAQGELQSRGTPCRIGGTRGVPPWAWLLLVCGWGRRRRAR